MAFIDESGFSIIYSYSFTDKVQLQLSLNFKEDTNSETKHADSVQNNSYHLAVQKSTTNILQSTWESRNQSLKKSDFIIFLLSFSCKTLDQHSLVTKAVSELLHTQNDVAFFIVQPFVQWHSQSLRVTWAWRALGPKGPPCRGIWGRAPQKILRLLGAQMKFDVCISMWTTHYSLLLFPLQVLTSLRSTTRCAMGRSTVSCMGLSTI